MLSKVRLKKYRKIKGGPQKLNFGASKKGFGGGGRAPLDPLVISDVPSQYLKLIVCITVSTLQFDSSKRISCKLGG